MGASHCKSVVTFEQAREALDMDEQTIRDVFDSIASRTTTTNGSSMESSPAVPGPSMAKHDMGPGTNLEGAAVEAPETGGNAIQPNQNLSNGAPEMGSAQELAPAIGPGTSGGVVKMNSSISTGFSRTTTLVPGNHGSSGEDSNGDRRISKEDFRRKFRFAEPFFKLGDTVADRLFVAFGGDANGLDFQSFVCALYMFTKSTTIEKQRLLFNMFDLNGSGFIKKKEFKTMALAIIRGDNIGQPEFDADFKALAKIMTDSAMSLYDQDRDGKLSFSEWLKYAENDQAVQSCLNALSHASAQSVLSIQPRRNP